VLFVGRLSDEKNIDAVVEAFCILLERAPVRVVFCGDGPRRLFVETMLARRGLTHRARVLGVVSNPWAWMKRANVFVSLSLAEGSPNAVLEAAACGAPLVLSDIPAHRDLVPEDGAWFVDPDNPAAAATAIVAALHDTDQAGRRIEVARTHLEIFGTARIGQQYDDVYRRILSRRVTASRKVAS